MSISANLANNLRIYGTCGHAKVDLGVSSYLGAGSGPVVSLVASHSSCEGHAIAPLRGLLDAEDLVLCTEESQSALN
jgi:hypothetical protein